MSTPQQRRIQAREQRILAIARHIAETEGWAAVTTRRLAEEVDYSQPVIYQHFGSRDGLIHAVMRQGFNELTHLVRRTVGPVQPGVAPTGLHPLSWAYLDFGRQQPALYDAMFSQPTALPFAQLETPTELRESFEALAGAIATLTGTQGDDASALTELFWACLHGVLTLHTAGRIPEAHLEHHIERISAMIAGTVGRLDSR